MDELDSLINAAIKKASTSGTLEDINKIAEIAKASAEANKAKADVANSRAQMQLEGLKSFATFLVPVVSLLTIAFTVYIQRLQLRETQLQNEATQWREFLSSAKISPNTVQSDITFSPRLRSFFSSPTYRDQAISISKRMMGGIANPTEFKDLFGVTFGVVDTTNFADVIDVGKLLNSNMSRVYSDCNAFADDLDDKTRNKIPNLAEVAPICSTSISEKTIKELGLKPAGSQALAQLRRDAAAFFYENWFLSGKLAEFLRSNYKVGSSPSPTTISLSDLNLRETDLSNVDFSSFDMSDTVIDFSVLKGAKLTPKKFGQTFDIRFSEWWEAQAIDQAALENFLMYEFPYYTEGEDFPSGLDVDREHYKQQIMALCVPMRAFCAPDRLKFGNKSTPKSQ